MEKLIRWIDERILDLMKANDPDLTVRMEELVKVKDKIVMIELMEKAK